MAHRNRYTQKAKATLCLTTLILSFFNPLFAQDEAEPDPWFTEEREAPEIEEETSPNPDEPTVVIRQISPRAIAKKLKKSLELVPEGNLSKRIDLLEEIVSTVKPDPEDQQLLAELKSLKQNAVGAIEIASRASTSITDALAALGKYSTYFTADPTLLVQLLESEFSNRLSDQASSLSRRGEAAELAAIESALASNGLKPIFGSRLKLSVLDATSAMVARRWEELSRNAATLPGEAYLLGQLLKQNDKKLGIAIELPDRADPKLISNISRSIENAWGKDFQIKDPANRMSQPEFILKINADRIDSTHTTSEKTVESEIPGAIVEEPNPDFLELVERYEKAAKTYENAKKSFDARYQQYLDQMDDTDYRLAQADLKAAESNLKATPPPMGPNASPEYEAAQAQFQSAQAMANSISAPSAIPPSQPVPYHLDILDDLYLVPSTLITSEEKTPYEYTEKEITYNFESRAPITLVTPVDSQIAEKSVVTLTQRRSWTKTEGTDPRDPTASDGTYSDFEYQSALDIFGLEFSAHCSQELGKLFESAKSNLASKSADLPQALLLVALKNATSSSSQLSLDESELESLATLAQNPNVSAKQFRAHCLAKLLSKTEFANMADEEKIARLL